ncbi:insulinase family protein [Shewanella sp. 3_MG-2023]|uniref:M16 family metallopeptidase n=1 Tax=Shewanella sp. 3_MG-2023 TaxID=3062635 RepID=UPI0026E1F311|nr:insulinase family protein [Shewanella sp. 3_MG-2023]MDO6775593.1 insulinase family protein [Shewanella sp. 3_MG-2023]
MKKSHSILWAKIIGLAVFICSQQACQHAPISFTPAQPPNLANYNDLPVFGSEKVQLPLSAIVSPQTMSLTTNSFLHQWSLTADSFAQQGHQLYLVGISTQTAIANPDIIIAAFKQRQKHMANTQVLTAVQAACYDSMRFRASLHSIGISINCMATTKLKSELLWQFWDNQAVNEVNIATIKRNLKLNKHIGAFTGSEIDLAFRKQLLGSQHPYNQNINNNAVIDELTHSSLSALHTELRQQLQWHLFAPQFSPQLTNTKAQTLKANTLKTNSLKTNSSKTQIAQHVTSLPSWLLTEKPDSSHSAFDSSAQTSAQTSAKASTINSSTVETSTAKDKILYIIDAPDTVQTQVRIGLVTATADATVQDANTCQMIAALLGRGYSGRLFYDLREVRGLSYGVYGRCVNAPLSQYMYFYGSTALENSSAFIKGMLDHLSLITEQNASQNEINATVTYLQGKQQLSLDSPFGKESLYIRQLLSGQTTAEFSQGMKQLQQLTPMQLLQQANTLSLTTPIVVLRGDADKISADLQQKLPTWELRQLQPD